MSLGTGTARERRLDFSVGEVTGAVGDSVTVLPIVVALGALTDASLAHVLVGFAVFQAVWGLVYGLPLSVEPMKALAGLAIAGALSYGELLGAGLLAGAVLLAAGHLGLVGRVASVVGRPVVRGVQFAVALLLVEAGLGLSVEAPLVAVAGLAVAGVATLLDRRAGALAVLLVGTAVALTGGLPSVSVPDLALFPTGGPDLTVAAGSGLAAQLAMTVGNAAVATSLLCSDLFDRDVSPDRLSRSMGTMNLLAVPFGAVPMCHGSGGLAGKHAFGARTGAANLVLAVGYLGAALVAGLWVGFPMALLGALLFVVAASLARTALTETEGAGRLLAVGVGVLAVLTNVGVAFVAGALGWAVLSRR
ncbi:putative sulfate/molybdate transporter [Salinirubellus salinus]|uniref:Sulfate/molybdate transporter n=1 Tax=Salinirubellus salinus TaxID=1364945 RepID=A0A9E7UCZ4_9EURY|nr:putative sulfate/molybdate transporter [Salinirubellus salinus]UWM56763.1 putative sulfate/molybdate transporter [Salinirubellus salinus]